jgi:hypothetical protein
LITFSHTCTAQEAVSAFVPRHRISTVVLGHLELFCADGILAALSTFSANWHSGELKIEVQQLTPLNKLPSTIQRLMPDAHVLAGALSSYR